MQCTGPPAGARASRRHRTRRCLGGGRRGQARYASACAACHLAYLAGTLAGDAGAPPLRGEAFVAFIEGWNARRLFEYVKSTMPADDPASLPESAYVDVLAYLFQANGFPAGSVELDIEQWSAIRLTGSD